MLAHSPTLAAQRQQETNYLTDNALSLFQGDVLIALQNPSCSPLRPSSDSPRRFIASRVSSSAAWIGSLLPFSGSRKAVACTHCRQSRHSPPCHCRHLCYDSLEKLLIGAIQSQSPSGEENNPLAERKAGSSCCSSRPSTLWPPRGALR